MPRRPPELLAAAALAAAVLLPACGSERRSEEAAAPTAAGGGAERDPEFFAAALASAEKAPDVVRQELLKTCDKWRHLDRPCDEEQVRRDQLRCWKEKGERTLAWVQARGVRPRASYLRTLLEVNVCMELKRWRKLKPGPDF